jgi:hypothetical protein
VAVLVLIALIVFGIVCWRRRGQRERKVRSFQIGCISAHIHSLSTSTWAAWTEMTAMRCFLASLRRRL